MATAADPTVISRTIQEFEGERYYLCGAYFQRNGRRLHVAVWERRHGKRPPGFEIHHVDENKAHNGAGNLECKLADEHRRLHSGKLWDTSPRFRKNIERACDAARAWHSTPEGRKLHEANGAIVMAKARDNPVNKACEACGKIYLDHTIGRLARTCSRACYASLRRASGVDDETRDCPACRREFRINRYSRTKTCSPLCGRELKRRPLRAVANG